jgi:hypothetical protein
MPRARRASLLAVVVLTTFLLGRFTAPAPRPLPPAGRAGCPYELACPYCRGRTACDANPFENVGLEPREEWERGWQSGLRHRQRLQADE